MSTQKKVPNARGGKKGGRRRFTPKPRPDQNSEKRKTGSSFTILDDEPQRIVNPLCDIPRIEGQPQHYHDPPSALELYVWTDLVFGKPDTFPLSYYARLLGFQVDPTPEDKYVALDIATIPRIKDVPHIPPLGSIFKTWRQEKDLLQYKDPVYMALLEESSHGVENLVKAAINHGANRVLSSPCIELAKELMGVHGHEFKTDDQGGEFGVVCGEFSIRYDFMWYQVSKEEEKKSRRDTAKAVNPHGLTSLASRVQKPKVSELTLHIKCIGKGPYLAPSQHESSNGVDSTSNSASVKLSSLQPSDSRLSTSGTSSTLILNPETAFNSSESNEKKENNEGEDFGAEPGQTVTGSENESTDDPVLIILTALCLEHARACDIFYGFVQVADPTIATLLCKYFRMVPLKNSSAKSNAITLLCDLNKCTSKYAFLLYKATPKQRSEALQDDDNADLRVLVRLPTAEMVNRTIDGMEPKPQKSSRKRVESASIKSAIKAIRPLSFGLRVEGENIKSLDNGACSMIEASDANNFEQIPPWNILRTFPTRASIPGDDEDTNEILDSLIKKRDEVLSIESRMEVKLRSILSAVLDERIRYEKAITTRQEDEETLKEYTAILNRRRELDLAFQKQRDQDMDAVCEICNDGEVTPDNQILFCEACNVAIHQFCYGIERVPEGDYYCIACRYFGREKANLAIARQIERGAVLKMGPSPLPINCELCPRKQGAFIRTDTSTHVTNADGVNVSKWIHVLCAKWQGLNFIDNEKKDCVEDVRALKQTFRLHGIICQLCQGDRGAFNQCRVPGCEKWLHVTCARSYGRCEVVHGENCHGEVLDNPWTLLCPDHSNVIPPPDSSTLEQLVMWAKAFPPEPPVEKIPPKPCSRPFGKLSGKERREFLSVLENEKALVAELMTKKLHGVRCEVCHTMEDEGRNLTKCVCCGVVFCDSCKLPFDEDDIEAKQFKCQACKFVEEAKSKEAVEKPKCVLCFQPGGWLRMARGTPMKKWAVNRQKEFEKTLFGKKLWVHALCAMWQHPLLVTDMASKEVNLSDAIMTHGKGFILGMNRCELCGQKEGLKLKCSNPTCRQRGHRSKPSHTHVTCARQAGFEVDTTTVGDDITFHIHCYRHVSCEFAFRARLEDLIEFEKLRTGKKMDDSKSMSTNHASRLLNSSILVMNYLGWAWRWAEWWVEYGSNWEPLIEPGQNEKKMTKEQLKIVDSTPESRCADARRCRLAALGSALRNRSYDDEEDGPTVMLERALRAVLNTPSLVGPLTKMEIDFFVQWLGIAYRSKSRLLGFGDDKIVVDESAPSCRHEGDKSPKFVLGDRRLPGKQVLPADQIFETDFVDNDDFLNPERLDDGMLYSEFLETKKALKQKQTKQQAQSTTSPERAKGAGRPKRKHSDLDEVHVGSEPAKKRGRPPKSTPPEEPAVPVVFTEKTSVLEQANAQIPKRLRQPTTKGWHSWGESAIESVLAVQGPLTKRGNKSLVPDPLEHDSSEHQGRNRRKSGLGKVTEEIISGYAKGAEANGDVASHVPATDTKSAELARTRNEDVSPKRRRGRPPKIRKVDANNGDATVRDWRQSFHTRRKAPVSYNEDDYEDFEDDGVEEKVPVSTKSKEYVIPRKAKMRLSPKEGVCVEERGGRESVIPLSSVRDAAKVKGLAQDRDDVDDNPEPDPDLSTPQKRGRYRGKLVAAKVILPGTDRSVL